MNAIAGILGGNRKSFEVMLSRLGHRGRGRAIRYDWDEACLGGVRQGRTAPGDDHGCREGEDSWRAVCNGVLFRAEDDGQPIEHYVLDLFRRKGPDFVRELDGKYALAITNGKSLVLARDPWGLKPLYYSFTDEGLRFASEIKALAGAGSDIKTFPPGAIYIHGQGLHQYPRWPDKTSAPPGLRTAAVQLREALTRAVQRRWPGSGRAGILLSGGLDSSCVAAATAGLGTIDTFAVGVAGSEDLHFAEKVSRYLGTRHHPFTYDLKDMLAVLPQVIYHLESFDAGLVRSSIPNYFAARLAAESGITDIFCGEGGDELFAGYHYLKDLAGPNEVEAELRDLLLGGHSNGFQRVDRMNAAHGLTYHIPFMDREVTDLALTLPVSFKIHWPDKVEKWILRQAFTGALPPEVLKRRKQKFSQGSGSFNMLAEWAEENISDAEFARERELGGGHSLASKEELHYYRIFKLFFPEPSVLDTIGRTRNL